MTTVFMSTSRRVSADSLTLGVTPQIQRLLGRRVDLVVSLDWKQRDITEKVRGTVDATAVVNGTTMCLTRMASAEKAARMIGTEREVQHAVPGVKGTEVHQDAKETEVYHLVVMMGTRGKVKEGGKEVLRVTEKGTIGETTAGIVIVTRGEAATGIMTIATGDQGIECLT